MFCRAGPTPWSWAAAGITEAAHLLAREAFLGVRVSYPRSTAVTTISGKFAGRKATIDANVFQRTADNPDDPPDRAFHVIISDDGGELWATVRWDQVCPDC